MATDETKKTTDEKLPVVVSPTVQRTQFSALVRSMDACRLRSSPPPRRHC